MISGECKPLNAIIKLRKLKYCELGSTFILAKIKCAKTQYKLIQNKK